MQQLGGFSGEIVPAKPFESKVLDSSVETPFFIIPLTKSSKMAASSASLQGSLAIQTGSASRSCGISIRPKQVRREIHTQFDS
jgi:hypothetical protein